MSRERNGGENPGVGVEGRGCFLRMLLNTHHFLATHNCIKL